MGKRSVTDADLNKFAELVDEKNKNLITEMINKHKKECKVENKELFVTFRESEDRCKVNRDIIHRRINKLAPVKSQNCTTKNNKKVDDKKPDAVVSLSISDHIKQHWFRYVLIVIGLGVMTLLGYSIPG